MGYDVGCRRGRPAWAAPRVCADPERNLIVGLRPQQNSTVAPDPERNPTVELRPQQSSTVAPDPPSATPRSRSSRRRASTVAPDCPSATTASTAGDRRAVGLRAVGTRRTVRPGRGGRRRDQDIS
ncbi:hypothetical protein PSD17_38400 [Pseudonocardia sp. D17]|nr:hypothetical protein PSD17_38400 [Pseudonocardia sp. D17]